VEIAYCCKDVQKRIECGLNQLLQVWESVAAGFSDGVMGDGRCSTPSRVLSPMATQGG
jgi:hypothetical protein